MRAGSVGRSAHETRTVSATSAGAHRWSELLMAIPTSLRRSDGGRARAHDTREGGGFGECASRLRATGQHVSALVSPQHRDARKLRGAFACHLSGILSPKTSIRDHLAAHAREDQLFASPYAESH